MQDITLTVVAKPEQETTAIHLRSKSLPFFRGNGDLRYLCGHCSIPLAIGVTRDEPITWTVRCGSCKHYNRLAVADGGMDPE